MIVTKKLQANPWKSFVPDLVTMFKLAADASPLDASSLLVSNAELLKHVRRRQRIAIAVLNIGPFRSIQFE